MIQIHFLFLIAIVLGTGLLTIACLIPAIVKNKIFLAQYKEDKYFNDSQLKYENLYIRNVIKIEEEQDRLDRLSCEFSDKLRIPLPKQTEKVFKHKTKYDRKIEKLKKSSKIRLNMIEKLRS